MYLCNNKKTNTVLLLLHHTDYNISEQCIARYQNLAQQLGKDFVCEPLLPDNDLVEMCETRSVSFLVLAISSKTKFLQKCLDRCRGLRIPYVFQYGSMPLTDFKRILLPIGFLEEEVEKAQFASAFGRFCESEITLLQAKDYGSRAQRNVAKISTLLDKFSLNYKVVMAHKADSFSVEKEAAARAAEYNADLLVISASRDYGLDDVIFGPKERHVIVKSSIPVMLINPRKDLYALCD